MSIQRLYKFSARRNDESAGQATAEEVWVKVLGPFNWHSWNQYTTISTTIPRVNSPPPTLSNRLTDRDSRKNRRFLNRGWGFSEFAVGQEVLQVVIIQRVEPMQIRFSPRIPRRRYWPRIPAVSIRVRFPPPTSPERTRSGATRPAGPDLRAVVLSRPW